MSLQKKTERPARKEESKKEEEKKLTKYRGKGSGREKIGEGGDYGGPYRMEGCNGSKKKRNDREKTNNNEEVREAR